MMCVLRFVIYNVCLTDIYLKSQITSPKSQVTNHKSYYSASSGSSIL